jgi:hypothetical protein
VFAGRRYAARSGIGLTIRGLPRRLPKRARKVRLTIRDQFGEIVPGVEVTLTHRHRTTHVVTNAHGLAAITLVRASTATVLRVSALGYRTVVDKLK